MRRPPRSSTAGSVQPPDRPVRAASLRSGRDGEDLACRALRRAGYRIVGRNVRTRHGEIDILARRRRCWIAVEVKARRDHPAPERCVAPQQLDRLERALRALAPRLRPRPRGLQIDVVAVRWLAADGTTDATRADLHHFRQIRQLSVGADGIG